MPLDHTAKGVFPIAPTPFHPDGRVDSASIDRLTDFYVGCGSTGLTVLGVMGEAPKLDGAEALEVATRFVRRAAGLPVVVGVSAPGFAAMRGLARAAMDAGAAGVMVAPPNTLRTDDQIVAYYAQAAEAVGADVPLLLTVAIFALGRVLARVLAAGIPLDGAADHGVSEALYLRDPDGNGVELYRDRPPAEWPLDAEGRVQMGNAPLDLAALLAEGGARPDADAP